MSEQNKIDEIKTALAAATPGPWTVYRDKSLGETLIGTAYDHPQLKGPDSIVGHVYSVQGEYVYIRDYDAHFIAKAPEYITYLLQEIERKDKALRFYADEETYEEKWVESAESWADPEIEGDRGEIAREAL